MDPFNLKRTSGGIIKIAPAKRKLRLSKKGNVLNPQPRSPKIRRKKRSLDEGPRFLGIYFPTEPLFISIQPRVHLKAKTIRYLNDSTVDVKFKTKSGTRFIRGSIVAHGGKYFQPNLPLHTRLSEYEQNITMSCNPF